mmetsp:Transcript_4868/g.11912  ORF Transcript_4868/g.11912 Transcript_4868/m.11912 type:complete len:1075 (+) Transcript_4868:28-3252(+)
MGSEWTPPQQDGLARSPLAQALDVFTHRHLREDSIRQAGELRRLCRQHATGFAIEELGMLSRVLYAVAEEAWLIPNVRKEFLSLVRLSGVPWRQEATAQAADEAGGAAVLEALCSLAFLPAHDVQEAACLATHALFEPTPSRQTSIDALVKSAAPAALLAKLREMDSAGGKEAQRARLLQLLFLYARVSPSVCEHLVSEGAVEHVLNCVGGVDGFDKSSVAAARPRTAPPTRTNLRPSANGWPSTLDMVRPKDLCAENDSSDAEDDVNSKQGRPISAPLSRRVRDANSRGATARPHACARQGTGPCSSPLSAPAQQQQRLHGVTLDVLSSLRLELLVVLSDQASQCVLPILTNSAAIRALFPLFDSLFQDAKSRPSKLQRNAAVGLLHDISRWPGGPGVLKATPVLASLVHMFDVLSNPQTLGEARRGVNAEDCELRLRILSVLHQCAAHGAADALAATRIVEVGMGYIESELEPPPAVLPSAFIKSGATPPHRLKALLFGFEPVQREMIQDQVVGLLQELAHAVPHAFNDHSLTTASQAIRQWVPLLGGNSPPPRLLPGVLELVARLGSAHPTELGGCVSALVSLVALHDGSRLGGLALGKSGAGRIRFERQSAGLLLLALDALDPLMADSDCFDRACESELVGMLLSLLESHSSTPLHDEHLLLALLHVLANISAFGEAHAIWPQLVAQIHEFRGVAVLIKWLQTWPLVLVPVAFAAIADWLRVDVLLQDFVNWHTPEHGIPAALCRMLVVWERFEAVRGHDAFSRELARELQPGDCRPDGMDLLEPTRSPLAACGEACFDAGAAVRLPTSVATAASESAGVHAKMYSAIVHLRRAKVPLPRMSDGSASPYREVALLHAAESALEMHIYRAWRELHVDINTADFTPIKEDEELMRRTDAEGASRIEDLWVTQAEMRAVHLAHEDHEANDVIKRFAHSKEVQKKGVQIRPHGKPSFDQRRRGRHQMQEMLKNALILNPPDEATLRAANFTQAHFDEDGVCCEQFMSDLARAEAQWLAEAKTAPEEDAADSDTDGSISNGDIPEQPGREGDACADAPVAVNVLEARIDVKHGVS